MTDTSLGGEHPPYTGIDIAPATGQTLEGVALKTQDDAGPASAKQAVQGLAGQARERLVNATDGQKAGVADRLDEVADSLHRSSEQFAGKQEWIAGAIARGGTELATLASSLRNADVADLLAQVKGFARRQPGLFIGASLIVGFAVARFGKLVAADVSRDDLPIMPEVVHGRH